MVYLLLFYRSRYTLVVYHVCKINLPVPNPMLVICVSMECAILTCLCGVFTRMTTDHILTHTHTLQKKYWQNNNKTHEKNQFDFHTHTLTHTRTAFKTASQKNLSNLQNGLQHSYFVSLQPIHR